MPAINPNPRREPRSGAVIDDKREVKARPKKKALSLSNADLYRFTLTLTHSELLILDAPSSESDSNVQSYAQINVPEINLVFDLHHDDLTIQIAQRILRLRNKLAFRDTIRDANFRANALDLSIFNLLRNLSINTEIGSFIESQPREGYNGTMLHLSWEGIDSDNGLEDPM